MYCKRLRSKVAGLTIHYEEQVKYVAKGVENEHRNQKIMA